MNPYVQEQLDWADVLPTLDQIALQDVKTAPMSAIYTDLLADFSAQDIFRARMAGDFARAHLLKGNPNPKPVIIWQGRVIAGHETVIAALDLEIGELQAYVISSSWSPLHAPISTENRA